MSNWSKISEREIRKEKIKKLKEKILREIQDQRFLILKREYDILNKSISSNKGITFSESDNIDFKSLITDDYYLIKLEEFIKSSNVFHIIINKNTDEDIIIYQIDDECLDIWLQDDYNFTLTYLYLSDKYDINTILEPRFLANEFITILEKCLYDKKKEESSKV